MFCNLPNDRVQGRFDFVRSTGNRFFIGVSMSCDGKGLTVFNTGFDHAALVIFTDLSCILICEVDFDSRDVITKMIQFRL